MMIYRSSSRIKKSFVKPVVAIGNFDGVHLGHKEILKKIIHKAEEIGGTSIAYTFHPHPSQILRPDRVESQINSIEERLALIANEGVEVAIVEPFDRPFSQKRADEFFEDIILKNLNTKYLYVGYNFFFGRGREGNTQLLKKLCHTHGIKLRISKPFKIKNEVISSSKIRSLIQSGNVKKASLFLGRNFFLQGITVTGAGRGKKLGIPTANIQTNAELIPKIGVYMTLTEYHGTLYPSVTNVGHAPTFAQKTLRSMTLGAVPRKAAPPLPIETHILDLRKELYGKPLILYFVDRLRDIKKFSSPKALVSRIKKDIETTRNYFK